MSLSILGILRIEILTTGVFSSPSRGTASPRFWSRQATIEPDEVYSTWPQLKMAVGGPKSAFSENWKTWVETVEIHHKFDTQSFWKEIPKVGGEWGLDLFSRHPENLSASYWIGSRDFFGGFVRPWVDIAIS